MVDATGSNAADQSFSESEEAQLHDRLCRIIENSSWYDTLPSIRDLDLPDWWVAGGAVRNIAWKDVYGNDCELGIKDIDVVFFDKNSGRDFEIAMKEKLQALHPQWIFDVKNQSSFGNWRNWHFKFSDSTDGISHFLYTANAVGARLNSNGNLELCTPYGLKDLFSGLIRPTPYRHAEDTGLTKQKAYLEKCRHLKVVQ